MSKLSDYDLMSLHWMARRYADGRSSYSPGLFNDITRKLLAAGVELKTPHFARDGMGRRFDRLTDEQVRQAESDMPRGFCPEPDARLADALAALQQIADFRLASTADFNAADMQAIARDVLAKRSPE